MRFWERLIDFWWYYGKNLRRHERNLAKYQGYGQKSILDFKRKNNLEWPTVKVILDNMIIIDGIQLRNIIRKLYTDNQELFQNTQTYITHFGPAGKSGGLILNQFTRCFPTLHWKIIPAENLLNLPENSTVIFLDDFVGTGNQAKEHIRSHLSIMNRSTKPYLFVLSATSAGLTYIKDLGTRFRVVNGITLEQSQTFLLDPSCQKLSNYQKKEIVEINKKLNNHSIFNQNLAFAFYYSIPDNSLPLLWLDGDSYTNATGKKGTWYGLTPRNY